MFKGKAGIRLVVTLKINGNKNLCLEACIQNLSK